MKRELYTAKNPEERGREIMKSFFRSGTTDLTHCAKLALTVCDEILEETLTEYTNDENHDRVLFYNDVKKYLTGFIELPSLSDIIYNNY